MSKSILDTGFAIRTDWKIFSLKDAFTARPPVKYVVKDVFEVPSLNIVYGAPGSLKSMLVADLVCCAVKGENWLSETNGGNKTGLQVSPTGVFWIDYDNGERRTHDRFAALGKGHNLEMEHHLNYVSVPTPWFDAGSESNIEELLAVIKKYEARMVVIDNLAAVSGTVDENSPAMAKIFHNLRWLSEAAQVAVVVIHHARKANPYGSRKGDALRGHSSIEGSIDLALYVNRKGKSNTITLEPTKVRGAEVPNITASFTYTNDKQGRLSTARFVPGDQAERDVTDGIAASIIACLGEKTMNQSQLTTQIHQMATDGVSQRQIHETISRLIKNGDLIEKRGPRNAKLLTSSKHQP